jgi:dTDP-4-amino-4,6-dideoxygalactose transaminase
MYYLLIGKGIDRAKVLAALNEAGIGAVFHYVPLHSSPAGRRYGRAVGSFAGTDDVASRLIRLPLWPDLSVQQIDTVIDGVHRALARVRPA